MNLVNIGLADLGADVIHFSSSNDSQLYPPNHILMDQNDYIWNSRQGLPQYLIISLEKVKVKYSHIATVGFFCWHDYPTNPKTIEIEVAQNEESQFITWTQLHLEQKNGKQFFNIPSLPACYRIIKIIITQTFGEFDTYLNQIMLMAKPVSSHSNSEMSINQIEYKMQDDIEEIEYQVEKNFKKKTEVVKNNKHSQNNSRVKQSKSRVKELGNDINFIRGKTQQIKRKDEISAKKQFDQQYYEDNESEHQIERLKSSQHESESQQEAKDESFEKNLALLTLSKKVVQMEQNMEEIKRNMQVLQLKINVSHETLQKNIMEKVEKLVESKLAKLKKELRQQIKNSKQKADLREVKSQREKRQLLQSGESLPTQDLNEDYTNFKGKSQRQPPKSLHINNLNQTERSRQNQKDIVVADLMSQLAKKLKQRDLKIKKMESQTKQEQRSRRNKYE